MRWAAFNKKRWHKVFAYLPVRVDDVWVWWEWVERREYLGVNNYAYEYRYIQ